MLIEIGGYFFQHDLITAFQAEGKNKTKVWVVGADTLTGAFLIEAPIEELIQAFQNVADYDSAHSLLHLSAEEQQDVLAHTST